MLQSCGSTGPLDRKLIMWEWVKKKWKVVTGAGVALLGGLFLLFRINSNERKQKEILLHANKSHKAELEANKKASDELEKGDQEIEDELKNKIDAINKESSDNEKHLDKEKKDFVNTHKDSDDLAKDLADAIGADFVDSSDE